MPTTKKPNSYNVLEVKIDPLTIPELQQLIEIAVQENYKWIIANHNLHSVYIYHHNSKMKAFYHQANYIHVDGMALVFMGKFLGLPLERKHRVTYADWVWELMEQAANQGWRIFYLGSKPGVADKGAKILQRRFPGLQITVEDGYFDPTVSSPENQSILAKIKTYQPNILMVGMSMPRQEYWILDNFEQIEANVILSCGACIDYIAGAIPTPPRWMGKVGLEWLYRLLSEPKRLWKRYLIEPWFLAGLLLKAKFNQFLKKS